MFYLKLKNKKKIQIKILFFRWTSLKKYRRTYKRNALPNSTLALVIDIITSRISHQCGFSIVPHDSSLMSWKEFFGNSSPFIFLIFGIFYPACILLLGSLVFSLVGISTYFGWNLIPLVPYQQIDFVPLKDCHVFLWNCWFIH